MDEYAKTRKIEEMKIKMKIGAGIMCAVIVLGSIVGFARSPIITEGNFGIEKHWGGTYNTQALSSGFNANIFDSIFEVYGREVLVKVEDVRPKDKDGIMLKDLDLSVAIKSNKENAVPFLLKTGDVYYDSGKGAFILGMNYVQKEAKSVASQTIRKFSSEELIDRQSAVEETFKVDLQTQLDNLYGKTTFTVSDVKISNVQFSDSTQQKIESIELIKSEEAKSAATSKILEIRNSTLNKEVAGMQKVAKDNNVTFDQLLDYQKTKAITEGASIQMTTSASSVKAK